MTGTILNAVTAAVMAVWPFFVLYAVTNGLMTLLLALLIAVYRMANRKVASRDRMDEVA